MDDADYSLLVTVRLYGGGTADEAARALRDYRSTFDLSGDREVEIIGVTTAQEHYVVFTEDRWTVEHSAECRLSGHMHECAWHAAVAHIAEDGYEADMDGRWKITGIDSEGLPSFERAESA
jgi:hypothetical protein